MIVGGRYSNDPAHPNTTGALSYYRLDFTRGESDDLMDILRNKDYQLVITACNGPGKPSPDDAYYTVKADMTAVVRGWDASEGGHEFEGQYFLRVNASKFEFLKEGGEKTLEVTTDHTDQVDISVSESWVKCPVTEPGSGMTPTKITITVEDNTASERSAVITVKVGNMSKTIAVTQAGV